MNIDNASAELAARLERGRTGDKFPKHGVTLAPILQVLHDDDYPRMAAEYWDALNEMQTEEEVARWLASLSWDLADAPWFTIARVLFYRIDDLETGRG